MLGTTEDGGRFVAYFGLVLEQPTPSVNAQSARQTDLLNSFIAILSGFGFAREHSKPALEKQLHNLITAHDIPTFLGM